MLITEYFQQIESQIADCVHILETNLLYDMAPHHREVETFPHHKQLYSNKVMESSAPAFANVLDEIADLIV